ncbi:GNAT family N-acetyltransferase [Candidatus Dependentiae bacterium]|nr:GNAT family N-acetyltransferase [Candidatus Dependentiae bacterium]
MMFEKKKKYLKLKVILGLILITAFSIISYFYLPKIFPKLFYKKPTITTYQYSKPDNRPTEIKGENITLKRLRPEYFKEYLKMINHPKVLKPLYMPKKITFNWIKEYLNYQLKREAKGKTFLYIIFHNENDKLIGSIEIRKYKPTDNGQFAVWLNPKYWGKGIVKEAFNLIAPAYFKLTNEDKFIAHVEMWNLRSYYALKKCGFKLVKTLHYKNKPSRYLLEYTNPLKK